MSTLAIKGHKTRGSEVIALLEMLGGINNRFKLDGLNEEFIYYICPEYNNDIHSAIIPTNQIVFTIEEFEEKFPYKVGDKVSSKYLKNYEISKMEWESINNRVIYKLQGMGWYAVNELQPYKEETMEKINIAELLKDCPKGMELDCTIFDNCTFDGIEDVGYINILVKTPTGQIKLSKEGCFIHNCNSAKCVIFPKGKTTWEGFVPPCKFKDGDIILKRNFIAIMSHIEPNGIIWYHCLYNLKYKDYRFKKDFGIGSINDGDEVRFATEEEKQKLFDAIKDNGYRWNDETKTLDKIVEPMFKVNDVVIWKHNTIIPKIIKKVRQANDGNFNYWIEGKGCTPGWCREDELQKLSGKFDITTLKPFESKVLIRNDESQRWLPAFWGYKHNNGYATTFGWCNHCIPFDGNEHLLGTTNDCDDFYKTWKE